MNKVFGGYAAYYDLLYKDKDYAVEANFVRKLLNTNGITNGKLLELGCGTGKHAELFARSGFSVHGVDMSPGMVEIARARVPGELINKLSFDVGDVRSYRTENKFDAVISLFHVASYQTSNEGLAAMFRTAGSHLERNGVFLFDCWYGPTVLTDRPVVRIKRLSDDTFDILRIAEPVMYPNKNIVDVNYTVMITDRKSGNIETIKESHSMRYLFLPELELLIGQAGFDLVDSRQWLEGELGFDSWAATIVVKKR